MRRIFVYGTLMKGYRNHIVLLGSKCIEKEAVLEDYAMYDTGAYPAVIPQKGSKVKGEIYLVGEGKIKILNMIEAEGVLYKLTPVKLNTKSGETEGETYIYLQNVEGMRYVPFENQPWRPNV